VQLSLPFKRVTDSGPPFTYRTSTCVKNAALYRTSPRVDARRRAATCSMMRRWKLPGRGTISRYYAHDASYRTSTSGTMRHVASKTPQKSNQFWFLRYVTHVNARWRVNGPSVASARAVIAAVWHFVYAD